MTDPVYDYRMYEDDHDMWEVFKTDEDGEDLVGYVVTETTAKRLVDGCNAAMGTAFVWIAVASGDFGCDEVTAVFSREELILPWLEAWFNRIRVDNERSDKVIADEIWLHDDGRCLQYTDEDMDETVRVSRMPVLI